MPVVGTTQYITETYTALAQFETDREQKLALGWILVTFAFHQSSTGENIIAVYRQGVNVKL